MSEPLRMFIPLTKVDAAQRLVYGLATAETVDRSGEICDYESTKPFYEKWSGDIAKSTGGKSFGNVRAMHGKVAAGKVTAITFNDAAKQIEIAAKVVDDAEWKKVEEGVYTGFSQGGGYVKRWKDDAGLQRYTADPSEVSLVDLPCLPEATFQVVKAAGAVEERHFAESVQVKAEPANADVAAKAAEMAKAAGKDDWGSFVEPAREALVKAALPPPPAAPKVDAQPAAADVFAVGGDEVEQVWKAKDGSTHAKKADALAKNAQLAATDAPGTKAALDKLDELTAKLGVEKVEATEKPDGQGAKKPGEGKDQADGGGAAAMNASAKKKPRAAPTGEPMKAATSEDLRKSLYVASSFAEMLGNLRSMAASAAYDSLFSGEDMDVEFAARMKAWVAQGCALLVAVVQDEIDGLSDADDALVLEMGAGLKPSDLTALGKAAGDVPALAKAMPILTKAGARNSKADQDKIQAMHDHACDLGAACSADNAKAVGGGELAKALADMTADRDLAKARGDALQKTIDEKIVPMLDVIGKRVETIERQPLPLPLVGNHRVVSKGGDEATPSGELAAQLEKMRAEAPEQYADLMIRIAQQQPRAMSLSV